MRRQHRAGSRSDRMAPDRAARTGTRRSQHEIGPSSTSSVNASKSTTWARLTRTRTASGGTSSSSSRESRARVLGRRGREHEDDARGLEQVRQANRLDPLVPQVRVGQPRVVRAELAAEWLEQSAQVVGRCSRSRRSRLGLPVEEKRVERVRAVQQALLSCAHRAILRDDVSRREASASARAISATAVPNAGATDSTRMPRCEAAGVVELRWPAAGDGDDRAQLVRPVQHVPVPPASGDTGDRIRQRRSSNASSGMGSSRPQTISTRLASRSASWAEKMSSIDRKNGSTMTLRRSSARAVT